MTPNSVHCSFFLKDEWQEEWQNACETLEITSPGNLVTSAVTSFAVLGVLGSHRTHHMVITSMQLPQLTRITHFRFIAISSNWALRRILTFAAICYSPRRCARLSRCTEQRFCLRVVAVMGCLLECARQTLASRLLCAERRPCIDQSETQPAAGSTATSRL